MWKIASLHSLCPRKMILITDGEEAGVALGASLQVVLMILLLACGLVGIWQSRIMCRSSALRKEEKIPPAPPALPVLGHLHLLGKLPHRSLAALAQQHAPHLMSLRLGSIPFLVVSSPEAAKLILHTHDHIFASRPQSAASVHIGFSNSGIALSPLSAYWRRMRGLCASDLFTNKRISSFQNTRRMEMHALLRKLFAKQGREGAVMLRPLLVATSLNMVSRMAMGQRLAEEKGLSDIGNVIEEVMQLLGTFNWGDYFPWLARFDVVGYERRMKRVGRRLSSALQAVLDTRKAARTADHVNEDLLDVLLAVPDIEDASVKAVIADLFIGGSDSTIIVVEWVLAELLDNPTALSTLQEELDQVVGKSRLVEEEDIPNLPFLNAVVKESMRLHPPGPFLLPRESIEACQVCDYIIPPKTRVLVNVWAIGRDPIVWENPLKFEPNRFMPKGRYNQVIPNGQHFELLPFGSGRRKCPALYLGLLNVHIMVAILLQCFDWSSKDPIDLSEKFGLLVTMASPLTTTLIPRIDASLYQNSV